MGQWAGECEFYGLNRDPPLKKKSIVMQLDWKVNYFWEKLKIVARALTAWTERTIF